MESSRLFDLFKAFVEIDSNHNSFLHTYATCSELPSRVITIIVNKQLVSHSLKKNIKVQVRPYTKADIGFKIGRIKEILNSKIEKRL